MSRFQLTVGMVLGAMLIGLVGIVTAEVQCNQICIHATGSGTDSLGSCDSEADLNKVEEEAVADGYCTASDEQQCEPDGPTRNIYPRKYKCVRSGNNYVWEFLENGDAQEADDCT